MRDSASRGAAGIKVWKDLGLGIRDETGELILCNDKRLVPLWEAAAELHLPVLIHIADPPAHFEALSEENERLEQLLAHPDWHYADPKFPRFHVLIEALEHLVAENPGQRSLGRTWAAMHRTSDGSGACWTGTRTSMLTWRPGSPSSVASPERQDASICHPTRILFGTDTFPPNKAAYSTYFRFFETDDEHFRYSQTDPPLSGRWAISGVYLPDELLDNVYRANALPASSRHSAWREPQLLESAQKSTTIGRSSVRPMLREGDESRPSPPTAGGTSVDPPAAPSGPVSRRPVQAQQATLAARRYFIDGWTIKQIAADSTYAVQSGPLARLGSGRGDRQDQDR